MLEDHMFSEISLWWNKFINTSSSARFHVLRQVRREISLRNIYTLQHHPNDLKKIILLSSHQTPNFMIRLLISIVPTHNLRSDIFMHSQILVDGVAIDLLIWWSYLVYIFNYWCFLSFVMKIYFDCFILKLKWCSICCIIIRLKNKRW